MTKIFLFFLIITTPLLFGQQKVDDPHFDQMLKNLLAHNVSEISVKEAKNLPNTIFLDARKKEEFNVSHLKNAIWIGYDNFNKNKLQNISTQKNIIIYCSVGYRSEKIAKKIEQLGYKNVYNLYGGIFEWKHQNNTVYSKWKPTDSIHTFDKEWSQWLRAGIKVY